MLGEIAEERGDIGSALKLFQQASSGTAELLARDPTNPLRIFEHSQSVFWVGSVASSRGQLKLAEAQYREYQRLANELVSKGGRQSKWLAEIGYADLDLGTALLAEHRIEPAITSLEQALKLEAELVQREPGNRDRLLDYAQALAWVADANMQLGETQAALRNRQTEQTVYVRLLKAVPNDRPTVLALVVNRDKLANNCSKKDKLLWR
jgi:tetratricopeptide (TPR) repeat protein